MCLVSSVFLFVNNFDNCLFKFIAWCFELIFVPWFIRSAVVDFVVFYTFIALSNIKLKL